MWRPNVDLSAERAFADHTDASLPRPQAYRGTWGRAVVLVRGSSRSWHYLRQFQGRSTLDAALVLRSELSDTPWLLRRSQAVKTYADERMDINGCRLMSSMSAGPLRLEPIPCHLPDGLPSAPPIANGRWERPERAGGTDRAHPGKRQGDAS